MAQVGWVWRDQYLEAEPAELQASLTQHPLPLEESFWLVASDRGSGKFSESAMLCNSFPFWNSRGQWFAGTAALFKDRELKFLFHQHILSADSAWATHKRMANPDS